MIYDKVKSYLQQEPRARERSNHQRGIVNVLLKDYPELKEIPKDKLVDFCHDFESHTRAWRQVLQECPELRGKDYNHKDEVEKDYQLRLGYNM